jgi:hypothetical protein
MTDSGLQQRIEELHQKVDRLLEQHCHAHARFLGIVGASRRANLSPESIRRLIAGGRLTAYRPVKGRVVIDVRELDAFVLGSTVTPRTGRGKTKQA